MYSRKFFVVLYLLFFISTFAQSWERMAGPYGGNVRRFYEYDSTLYALVDGDVYKLENNIWKPLNLPTGGNFIFCLHVFKSGKILVGSDFGLYYLNKGKTDWIFVNPFMNKSVRDFYVLNDSTLILSTALGIYKTNDSGNSFSLLSFVNNENVATVNFDNAGNIWAGTSKGLYKAKYPEMLWEKINLPESYYTKILFDSNGWIYTYSYYQLCRSFDNGKNWSFLRGNVNDMYIDESNRLVAAVGYKILRINFKGVEWESQKFNNVLLTLMKRNNRTLIGTMGSGVYDYDESNNTFTTFNDGLNSITVRGMEVTKEDVIVITTDARIIYFSFDNGETWEAKKNAWANTIKVTKDNTVYVAAEYGITKTNDNGNSWIDLNINVGPYYISDFDVSEDNKIVCAGSSIGEVFVSTDGGNTFRLVKKISNWFVDAIKIIDENTYLVYSDFLYYTKDAGKTFIKIENNKIWRVQNFAIDRKGYIYLASFGGVFKSLDGKIWNQINFDEHFYGANKVVIDTKDNIHLLAEYNDFVSIDVGKTWQNITGFIPNISPRSYAVSPNGYVWLGSQNSGLFRLKLDIKLEVPNFFSLLQNFPNPFNTTTRIEYYIPIASNVSLKTYDILGREVETIVNAYQEKGYYYANWNASKYSSGIYFYRLQTPSFSETKKMILLK